MCCRYSAATLLSHLTILLAVWCGLALAWCGCAVSWLADARGELPAAADAALLLPFVAAPLALLLAHAALAGARPPVSRPLLITYAVAGLVWTAGCLGAVAWAGAGTARWAQGAGGAALRSRGELRAWLAPLLALLASHAADDLPAEEVRWEVGVVWGAALAGPLLQLLCALLALCAGSRRPRARSSLRRSSSVYYEPSAPPPLHKAPLDQQAPWM